MNNIHHIQLIKDIKRDHGTYLADKVIEKLQFAVLQDKEYLYQIGEAGNKLFILLTGRLEVFMMLPEYQFELKKIKEILPVQQVGESALHKENCKRNQTVIAVQTSTVAFLTRKDYMQLVGRYQQDNLESKIKLLLKLECFNSWTLCQLKSFSCCLYQQNCCFNQIVYKENETSEFLFIVKDGQFEMVKHLQDNLISRSRHSTICLLNEGQVFGEESLMQSLHSNPIISQPNKQYQDYICRFAAIKCISISGSLYRISRQDIIEGCWDESTKYQFLTLLTNLKNFRLQRILDLKNNADQVINCSKMPCLTEPESNRRSPKQILEPIFSNTFFQKYYQSQQKPKFRSMSTAQKLLKHKNNSSEQKSSNAAAVQKKQSKFQRLLSQRYQKSTIKQETRSKSFDIPLNKFGQQYYKQFLVSERLKHC